MNKKKRRAFLRARDGDRCAWCRRPLHGGGTIEHIVPVIRGGSDDAMNQVLACKDCNGYKSDRMPRDPVWCAYYRWRRLEEAEKTTIKNSLEAMQKTFCDYHDLHQGCLKKILEEALG